MRRNDKKGPVDGRSSSGPFSYQGYCCYCSASTASASRVTPTAWITEAILTAS